MVFETVECPTCRGVDIQRLDKVVRAKSGTFAAILTVHARHLFVITHIKDIVQK